MSYCTYTDVRNKTGFTTDNVSALTDTIITDMITDADREIDVLTGRKWSSANAVTEYQDGQRQDMFENNVITIMLSNYSIQTITEFLELSTDGSTAHTYGLATISNGSGEDSSGEYTIDATIGKITLLTRTVPEGVRRIKISYTYGYTTLPNEIKEISACLSGIRAVAFVTGGVYNGVKNYSIPEMNVGKEQAERLQRLADYLKEQTLKLLDSPTVGQREKTLFVVTSGTRWGTQTSLSS